MSTPTYCKYGQVDVAKCVGSQTIPKKAPELPYQNRPFAKVPTHRTRVKAEAVRVVTYL